MRISILAALLFAIGFAVVAIGQQAVAYRHSQALLALPSQAVPARSLTVPARPANRPVARPVTPDQTYAVPSGKTTSGAKTFADYLDAAGKAFAAMDRTCLDTERMALGEAFHDLVQATGELKAGKIELGKPAGPAGTNPALAQLGIFAQVIDASQRGILQGRHFPLGPARLMHVQVTLVRGQDDSAAARLDRDLQDLASLGLAGIDGIGKTRCQPV